MMRLVGVLVFVGMLASVAAAQDKREISVESMPPSVVKTVPQAGDTAVARR